MIHPAKDVWPFPFYRNRHIRPIAFVADFSYEHSVDGEFRVVITQDYAFLGDFIFSACLPPEADLPRATNDRLNPIRLRIGNCAGSHHSDLISPRDLLAIPERRIAPKRKGQIRTIEIFLNRPVPLRISLPNGKPCHIRCDDSISRHLHPFARSSEPTKELISLPRRRRQFTNRGSLLDLPACDTRRPTIGIKSHRTRSNWHFDMAKSHTGNIKSTLRKKSLYGINVALAANINRFQITTTIKRILYNACHTRRDCHRS